MFRPFPVVALLAGLGLLLGCAHRPAVPPPPAAWPHELGDLPPDAAVKWGRLANGLRYALLPHAVPKQRASALLLVQAGSFHERDRELGYAHFVEHMAFRGLRDFPGTAAAEALERLGAGPHANADTGPFETRYFFHQLPVGDTGEPDPVALRILRSVADGIAFDPGTVEQERGVIFGEQRSRDGMLAQSRADEVEFAPPHDRLPHWPEVAALFAGTRIAERHPLGTERRLQAATAGKLRAFYERWYRPERMILVVAGDIAPDRVEQCIVELFSDLAAKGRAPAEPAVPPPANPGHLELVGNNAEPAMLVSLGVVRDRPGPDSLARRRDLLARRLALAMLSERLRRAVDAGTAPFFTHEAFASHYVPGRQTVLLRARTRPDEWIKALGALDLEVRRANELGFSAAEFRTVADDELRDIAAAARQSEYRSSAELAQALAAATARGVVFTSAGHDREFVTAHLAQLDAKQCHVAFRSMLLSGEWALSVVGPLGDPEKRYDISFKESRTAPLVPYEPPAPPPPFPFADYGPPGPVAKHDRAPAIDTELVEFANGVRLNLKRTRFEPGNLRAEFRLAGGKLAAPPGKPGLELGAFHWLFGGIEGVSPDDLVGATRDLFQKLNFGISPAAFTLTLQVQPEKLPRMFQVGAAWFTRPAFRAEAATQAAETARLALAPHHSTAGGFAFAEFLHRMTARHPAFRPSGLAELSAHPGEEFRAWFVPLLASAPLEISLLGDFDPAAAIDACARTFGAFPVRAAADPYAAERRTAFPPAAFSETLAFKGESSVAVVTLGWPAPEAATFPGRFRAHLLAAILEGRVVQKLRREMGETYSPGVSGFVDDGVTHAVAFLHCTVEAAPARLASVAAATREVAATLQREGATADEFARARERFVRETETGIGQNGWWSDVVAVAQSNPAYGEGWARALEAYRAATLEEINALAREVLAPARLCELLVRPEK